MMMKAGMMIFCTTAMIVSLAHSAPPRAPAKPAPSRCCWMGRVVSLMATSKREKSNDPTVVPMSAPTTPAHPLPPKAPATPKGVVGTPVTPKLIAEVNEKLESSAQSHIPYATSFFMSFMRITYYLKVIDRDSRQR